MQPPKAPTIHRTSALTAAPLSQAIRPVVAPPPLPAQTANRSSVGPWMCLAGAGLLFTCVVGAIAWRLTAQPSPPQDVADHADIPQNPEVRSSEPPGRTDAVSPLITATDEVRIAAEEAHDAQAEPVAEEFPAVASPQPVAERRDAETASVFADLDLRGLQLELPQQADTLESVEVKLASLPVSAGETVQLALLADDQSDWKLAPAVQEKGAGAGWTAIKQAKAALENAEDVPVALFRLQSGDLLFQWIAAPDWAKPQSLQFLLLEVRVGSQSRSCQLWKTREVPPIPFDLNSKTQIEFPPKGMALDRPEMFRVCFQLGGSAQITHSAAPVSIGSRAILPLEIGDGQAIDLELTVGSKLHPRSLEMKLKGDVPAYPEKRRTGKNTKPFTATNSRIPITDKLLNTRLTESEASRKKFNHDRDDNQKMQANEVQRGKQQQQQNQFDDNIGNKGLNGQEPPPAANPALAQLKQHEALINSDLQAYDAHKEWCEAAKERLNSLESEFIHYAIYLEGSRRIVVIQTDGFDWSRVQP